jgi:hypothetical protein
MLGRLKQYGGRLCHNERMLRKFLLALLTAMALFAMSATPASADTASHRSRPNVFRYFNNSFYPGHQPGYVSYSWQFAVEQQSDFEPYFLGVGQWDYRDDGALPGGYAGLDNNLYVPYGTHNAGHGVDFRIFNATNAWTDNPNAVAYQCTPATCADGTYMNVALVYNWQVGHLYTFTLGGHKLSGTEYMNGLWDLTLVDNTINSSTHVGTIQVPTSWNWMSSIMDNFLEWVSGSVPGSPGCDMQDASVLYYPYNVVFPTYPPQQLYPTAQYGGSSQTFIEVGSVCGATHANAYPVTINGNSQYYRVWIG